jgi:phospholipid transport system transporter-binding protein
VELPASVAVPPSTTFSLPAECTVSGATSLKESLAGLLAVPLPVTLDIAALQRIDTAALQVITAFVRERGANGRQVEWQGSAPVIATAAQLLGLTSLLKLPA